MSSLFAPIQNLVKHAFCLMGENEPPLPSRADLARAKQAILARHVEQLHQPRLLCALALGNESEDRKSSSIEETKSKSMKDLVGIGVLATTMREMAVLLSQWTGECGLQVEQAKAAYAASAFIHSAVELSTTAETSPEEIHWPITRLALMQSTAMYLRNLDRVKLAIAASDEGASEALKESQKGIGELARSWGLEFMVLCDLVDDHPLSHWYWDGPFCGAFYPSFPTFSSSTPFILLAFKGTTPTNVGEWLVDLDFAAAVPAASAGEGEGVCFGAPVSKGVSQALFEPYDIAKKKVPFDLIIEGLRDLACALGGGIRNPVPVYVTGHSLGASYATLFYAEALRRPPNKEPFVLVDLHTFGAPRVGLSQFGLSLCSLVASRNVHTWRIANTGDLVTSVPPVVNDAGQEFEHMDCGLRVEKGKPSMKLESELGKGAEACARGGVIDHACERYWEALGSAAGRG
ncbi:alpha/beta-hydrolase [Dacryopinax primogenitus]|uniref:Alpha/beta-hydrolase n=1 Tax=Dacryopinax primogenitus (strain DJM 731) TaxID=1858805 RepID=M5FNF2_DACPD|nr:alpha/beta-hydrolase [Dacryopinax primogenitus]EJT97340.1 alpha/beta-hydrolase [Dacryopinax primogenitus]